MKTHIWSIFILLSLIGGPQLLRAEGTPAETVTLNGYFFKRPDNTYLHVEMVGVRMVFALLDDGYRKIDNVFTRGIMTVDPRGKTSERMAISASGDVLQGVKTIRKPHILKANVRLFKGDNDSSGETFNILYNQHTLEEVKVVPLKPEK